MDIENDTKGTKGAGGSQGKTGTTWVTPVAAAAASAPSYGRPEGIRNANSLVIDDDAVFSGILARGLTRRGYTVQQAHDAISALRLAELVPFGQITVDLHLGEDSGLTLIAPLRQLQPHARILVLTGYASIATAVQAVKDGADNYLAKPANVETILSALQQNASSDQADEALENPVPLSVARLEWEHIQRVLAENSGNISATARALNMHRRTLQRKLAKRPVRH
jgi:two-component system response regulator RegA